MFIEKNIPGVLKNTQQWVAYNTNKENRKFMSSPVARFAKSNQPATWVSYEIAKSYADCYFKKGLAFALTREQGEAYCHNIVFIDLDHILDDTGEIVSPVAKEIIELFPGTYMERSTSKTGIHILVHGNLNNECRNINKKNQIEMYDTARFICLTGDLIGSTNSIADYSDKIVEINQKYLGKQLKTHFEVHEASLSDYELIRKIDNSKQSEKFRRLYSGNVTGYTSHSEADAGLVSLLAWWTDDIRQIDRIFRMSELYRPKWDRRLHGDSTYGWVTINNAMGLVAPYKRQRREFVL